jgi:hypothetical protein
MQKGVLSVIAVLVLLGAGAWYISTYVSEKPLTNDEDLAVRSLVTAFGSQLRFVSLLAPTSNRRAAMEQYYGPYLSPELLASWAPEGTDAALGRYTSSPSPDRIEVVEVRKTRPDAFVVDGTVIETANNASSTDTVVGGYPVTLDIRKQSDRYVITGATKGAYSTVY